MVILEEKKRKIVVSFFKLVLSLKVPDFGRNFFPEGMNGNEISSNDHVRSVCLSLIFLQ
jgi:hypothetical protein